MTDRATLLREYDRARAYTDELWRDLTPDAEFDAIMDSTVPERLRGALPAVERVAAFRATVAERVHVRISGVRANDLSRAMPDIPVSDHLACIDDYLVVGTEP